MNKTKHLRKMICLVFLLCATLVCLAGCSESIEDREEKVNEAIENVLASLNVEYTLEVKSNVQNDYVIDRGKKTNYAFNAIIKINDESLSDKDIFGIIEVIDDVGIKYTDIYCFYTINGISYYIQDDYILIRGYDYDIAYTTIAEKQGVDLTAAEKRAICNWIDSKYERYDLYSGGYSGDKYSDVILEEASEAFNISLDDLNIIWMMKYS